MSDVMNNARARLSTLYAEIGELEDVIRRKREEALLQKGIVLGLDAARAEAEASKPAPLAVEDA